MTVRGQTMTNDYEGSNNDYEGSNNDYEGVKQ